MLPAWAGGREVVEGEDEGCIFLLFKGLSTTGFVLA